MNLRFVPTSKRLALLSFVASVLLPACRPAPSPSCWLVLRGFGETDWSSLQTNAGSALRGAERVADRVVLTLDGDALPGKLRLQTTSSCALVIPGRTLRTQRLTTRELVRLLRIEREKNPVGAGSTVDVRVRPGCPEAETGRIVWTQSGTPLAELLTQERGFSLTATTQSAQRLLDPDERWGIVPVSPRTQGKTELLGQWTGGDTKPREATTRVVLTALSRSSGLPNVALGHSVVLQGEGLRVVERPADETAVPRSIGSLMQVVPSVAGRWRFSDEDGRSLSLHAGSLALPLDCGRADCHQQTTRAAKHNPMLDVLRRELAPGSRQNRIPCALACHSSGDPGVADDGFSDTLAQMMHPPAPLPSWSELPPLLQRGASVGCVTCHGPARIPEPSARFAILEMDVCAQCHDAPPRYGHVEAFRATRMARSASHPELRDRAAECARCHTTNGFLEALGDSTARPVPPDRNPTGISCVACHAVHPHDAANRPSESAAHALLREALPSPLLALIPETAGQSRICINCHSRDFSELLHIPAAADLWLGRGGVDRISGAALHGDAPHAAVPGGCMGCHKGSDEPAERGASHGFAVDYAVCRQCHSTSGREPSSAALTARWKDPKKAAKLPPELRKMLHDAGARVLASRATTGRTHHAAPKLPTQPPATDHRARNLDLLLSDPAAYAHNPSYVRKLLSTLEGAP